MEKTLTLLVTLKDRAEFTPRLYNYLASIKYPFSVLFADGSLGEENEKFFQKIKGEKKFNFTYIRYPKDLTLENYYQKCAKAINSIKTPYVMLADNDDFPCTHGQKEAISFLEKNPEYIGCNGQVGGFINSFSSFKPFGKNFLYFPYYSIEMDQPVPLDQPSAMDRISSYLNNFYSCFYSVFKTSSLQKTFNEIAELNFSELGIYELFLNYYQLVQGKAHSIPFATYMRQQGSSQSAVSQKDWFDRLFYTNWLEDFKLCIHTVAQEISSREGAKLKDIEEILYANSAQRLKKRFIPNTWYIWTNTHLLWNKEILKKIILGKIFALWPWMGEKISWLMINNDFRNSLKQIIPHLKQGSYLAIKKESK